ncbi:MAG TPA: hypothetical protein DIT04_12750 [Dysgonomonas sp.]|nr:hypothetical protein [Dysgonomonas sp.]
MKKIILALSLIFVSASFVTSQAQHISVNININSQPAWGPVGYDYVDYYYIPEINVYYNVPSAVFYYMDRGRWISARYLPYSYRNYNLYGMYKVVLNTRDPWHYNRHHIRDYARYRNMRNQHVIYYAKDHRYNHSRRNTVAWYKGGKHNAPPKYKDNNHRSKPGKNESYGHNNRKDRVDNNRIQNNNRNNNSRPDRERVTKSSRNNSSQNRNSRQQPSTRSSQSYLVNNASKKNESSSRSSSRNSASHLQSERTSNTRSNR